MTQIDEIEFLIRLHKRLQQIKNQVVDVEARIDALDNRAPSQTNECRCVNSRRKYLDENANASNPRTAAQKHSAR